MLTKSQFKTNTPKAYQQYSPDYGWRLYRLSSANLSKSQIRGHARPSERSVKELRAESKRSGFDFLKIPRLRDKVASRVISRKNRSNDKYTHYVEFAGGPSEEDIMKAIYRERAKGFTAVRLIRGDQNKGKTTQWIDIEEGEVESAVYEADSYSDYGYAAVFALAFS